MWRVSRKTQISPRSPRNSEVGTLGSYCLLLLEAKHAGQARRHAEGTPIYKLGDSGLPFERICTAMYGTESQIESLYGKFWNVTIPYICTVQSKSMCFVRQMYGTAASNVIICILSRYFQFFDAWNISFECFFSFWRLPRLLLNIFFLI